MSKPSIFFAAMLRGPAAKQVEQVFVSSGLRQKQGNAGWAAGNRHQSLSDLQQHPVDVQRLLKVGAAVRCAPVVLRLGRIEGRGRNGIVHWELRAEKSAQLEHLLDAIRLSLIQHGLDKGSRNTPHVTLHYRAPFELETPVIFTPIEWRIDKFQLVRSTGHGATYHYEELGSWPLNGEPESGQPQLALL